jgi:putative membrane protein
VSNSTDRNDLAGERTDLAEDRTVLANERTFAGWLRTGLAAIGIGVGFHALFGKLEPPWLPKAVATLVILTGMFIVVSAQQRACAVVKRLDAHKVKGFPRRYMLITSGAIAAVATLLIAGIWLVSFPG